MTKTMAARLRRLVTASLCSVALMTAAPLVAQSTESAQLRVTVLDQTGGFITSATVRIDGDGASTISQVVDALGRATFESVSPGRVQLHTEAPGFAASDDTIALRPGGNTHTVTLKIAILREEVLVSEETSLDARNVRSMMTTLEEEDLAALPEDPDELADVLDHMTGGAGAVFEVDGFRGGRLPPRSEIRQVRFHLTPLSADNHDAGRVRVEVITKPTTGEWTGNANLGFRSDVLAARNAFARARTPEQVRRFNVGLRGPIVGGRTAVRINVDANRSFDSATIVAQLPSTRVADIARRPVDQTNLSVALEHALTASQTLRLDFRDGETQRGNLGVGDFNLPERAYNTASHERVMRAQVRGLIGTREHSLRVQVQTQRDASTSMSSAPAIVVIDAFSTGGSGISSSGKTTNIEVADDLDITVARPHAMRVGFLFDHGEYRWFDARNAAGTFTFGSLANYLNGRPNTFTQRLGQAETAFAMNRLGVYWQDEVRVSRAFSYSLGVRQEVQSHVHDALNVMPRVGFTFVPPGSKMTFRGGYGLFHDWYESNLYDQTVRVNGVVQRDLLILTPGYPDPFSGPRRVVLPGGRVQADPNLRLPYEHQWSAGVERSLWRTLTLQAMFTRIRGFNQLRSRNVNAPNEAGVRPEPTTGTVTRIESSGRLEIERLNVNANYRSPRRRLVVSADYTWSSAKNHTNGPLQLPANNLDMEGEWGPAPQDLRHRFDGRVNALLPLAIRANISTAASSAAPYTITTGRDDNRDGVSNDRPTGGGRNTARGAARIDTNVRVTRAFALGAVRQPGSTGNGVRRPSVEFYAQGSNVFNHTNFLNFSGNLLSPFFGHPTSASPARRVEFGTQFRF